MNEHQFVVTLTCDDKPGIVAAVTTELAAIGANIAESNQFWDRQTNRFFLRIASPFVSPVLAHTAQKNSMLEFTDTLCIMSGESDRRPSCSTI